MEGDGKSSIDDARRVLRIEAEAVGELAERLGPSFDKTVQAVMACRGRVVITGMGKSGLIGRKIAATLASTGTPALYMHPAEGGHGDIGMLVKGDIVISISRSGETAEILALLPSVKALGVIHIALSGAVSSTLAREADIVLDVSVREEACPMDLVPTASTTAALAMGDALAVSVLKRRGLTPEDYAVLHPAGSLGRRLLLRIDDIMRRGGEIAVVRPGTSLKAAILEMTAKKMGATCVVGEGSRLVGILTDHDLRRAMARDDLDINRSKVDEVMTRSPLSVKKEMLVAEAMRLTQIRSVSVLPVLGPDGELVGIVHLHDLLRSGVL